MDNASARAAQQSSPLPPPRARRLFIKVARAPKGGAEIKGICLNQELWGQWTHWFDMIDGKIRCSGDEKCRYCPYLPKARWYGYMPAFMPSTGRIGCLEVTVEAARECPQLNGKRIPLRGKLLTTFRIGKGKMSQCRARVEEYREQQLPNAVDIVDLMEALFEPDERCFNEAQLNRRKEDA